MATVRLRDGRHLHVHTVGRGPTVVLLHGFAMHGRMWLPSVLPLAHRYRFVLPDLAGFGRSHHVPFAHDDVVRSHAQDVADLIDALGERTVRLGGLSMGALTSLRLLHDGGFRKVSSYVHMDQAARIHNDATWQHGLFGPEQPARFAEMRELLERSTRYRSDRYHALPDDLRRRIRGAFAQFFRAAFRSPLLKSATAAMERERVATSVLPVSNWGVYLDTVRAYLDERHDFTDAVSAVDVPVTYMIGEASEMYPAEGQRALAARTPGARVVSFEGTGHALNVEAPRRFVREFAAALDGPQARGPSRG